MPATETLAGEAISRFRQLSKQRSAEKTVSSSISHLEADKSVTPSLVVGFYGVSGRYLSTPPPESCVARARIHALCLTNTISRSFRHRSRGFRHRHHRGRVTHNSHHRNRKEKKLHTLRLQRRFCLLMYIHPSLVSFC